MTKRDELIAALLTEPQRLAEAATDALAAAGAIEEWDDQTVELVIEPLQELIISLGFPAVGEIDEEATDFWMDVDEDR